MAIKPKVVDIEKAIISRDVKFIELNDTQMIKK